MARTGTRPDITTIMVSSTVYGSEEMLNQVYGALTSYGYRVWMSHAGTVPVDPSKSNFQNCIKAVDDCHAFLGIITGRYGSGVQGRGQSITHSEMLRAIEIRKPAWFLVNHDVVVARQVLKQFRFTNHHPPRKKNVVFKSTPVIDNLKIIDMYEAAMRLDLPLEQRVGNWVQEYFNTHDVLRFLEAQFSDISKMKAFIASSQSQGVTP
jgi:hypothetical protein